MTLQALSERRWDVVIAGARCAGAATAAHLARAGLAVLAIDRGPEGGDTLSTHALMRGGVLALARLGVLDGVVAAGAPAIATTTFHYGDETIAVPIAPKHGVDALRAPRRTLLDRLLGEAARAAGAVVVHGPHVADVTRDASGRVDGVVIADGSGATARVRAGVVVGADGLRSVVARAVRAPVEHAGTHASSTVFRLVPGLEPEGYHWHYRPGFAAGVIPTNGGESVVFSSMASERFRRERGLGLEALFFAALDGAAPGLAAALRGRPGGPWRAFSGRPGYLRRAWGPGWALVGDAGSFRDPITSHGMTDALRDAEWLADALVRDAEPALREYQAARDEASLELMRLSDAIAGFEWSLDEVKDLHRRLSRRMTAAVEATLARDGVAGAQTRVRPAGAEPLPHGGLT